MKIIAEEVGDSSSEREMGHRIGVLCVDDEAFVLEFLQALFSGERYRFYAAKSAFDGLLILAKAPSVRVVISDYRMPGMDGFEFLREVSSLWPRTVRIMTSAAPELDELDAAMERGDIHRFILKPWESKELVRTVAEATEDLESGA